MYNNQYQYGKHVNLLAIQDKETIDNWATPSNLKKAYDKSAKGYVYVTTSQQKWKHPKDERKDELALVQPYLVLQCKVLDRKTFHFEVVFTDMERKRRRLIFYSAQFYQYSKDNIHRMPLHARVPCGMVMEGMWMNL